MRSLISPARHVAETPELLYLISAFLGRHDRVSLLRVSQRTFACVVASLWKCVRDVTLLLKLIPGVKIINPEENGSVCCCPKLLPVRLSSVLNYSPPG